MNELQIRDTYPDTKEVVTYLFAEVMKIGDEIEQVKFDSDRYRTLELQLFALYGVLDFIHFKPQQDETTTG